MSALTLNTIDPVVLPCAIGNDTPFGQHTSADAGDGALHDVEPEVFVFHVTLSPPPSTRLNVTVAPPDGAAAGNVTETVTSTVPESPSATVAGATDTVSTDVGTTVARTLVAAPPTELNARIFMRTVPDSPDSAADVDDPSVLGKSNQLSEPVAY
ncbi:hypothetical protein [Candidatus Poriferisodalis sp.]|uniref:hypothetical protein n=1 Tax=Candidatus Poriferisodalis sp. TaxID=3101277 RepID=UPI003B01410C